MLLTTNKFSCNLTKIIYEYGYIYVSVWKQLCFNILIVLIQHIETCCPIQYILSTRLRKAFQLSFQQSAFTPLSDQATLAIQFTHTFSEKRNNRKGYFSVTVRMCPSSLKIDFLSNCFNYNFFCRLSFVACSNKDICIPYITFNLINCV